MFKYLLILLPWIEGRYIVPILVKEYNGNLIYSLLIPIAINSLIPIIVFGFLDFIHPKLIKISLYKKIYYKIETKIVGKAKNKDITYLIVTK